MAWHGEGCWGNELECREGRDQSLPGVPRPKGHQTLHNDPTMATALHGPGGTHCCGPMRPPAGALSSPAFSAHPAPPGALRGLPNSLDPAERRPR